MDSPRLKVRYHKEICPEMIKRFGYKNPMQVPMLEKITINMGIGKGIEDIKLIEKAQSELAIIVGQRPAITRAKKAISNFKLRRGLPIGCKVTLRRNRMFEFLDRLTSVAMPRMRDFRGVNPDSFDTAGNYTLGLTEQHVFPEVEFDKVDRVQGMDVTFVVRGAKTKEESKALLELLGLPFTKKPESGTRGHGAKVINTETEKTA